MIPPDSLRTHGSSGAKTPGYFLADRIRSFPQVRYVREEMEAGRSLILVALDDDPDNVLDAIFETERSLYHLFPQTPFDVRVTKIRAG